MRKVFVTGVCTLMLAGLSGAAGAQAAPKFAYINSAQLFQSAPGRVEATAALEKERNAAQDRYKAMQDTMSKLTEAYNKEEAALTPLVRAERMKVIRDKQTVFEERAQKMTQGLQEREAELGQPIQELIQKVLEEFRAENGLTMIFDVASGQGIAAIDKNLDKTDVIAARLSKMPAPKAAAAAAKSPTGPAVAPSGVKRPPTE